jgi:uncharacterized lipoprotein NlpE involved in copper resistance
MKLPHIVCLAALTLLTACKNEEKSADSQTTVADADATTFADTTETATPPPVKKPAKPIVKTASWHGKYSGVLPCGDCKGIFTIITVDGNNTYKLLSKRVGKGEKEAAYDGTYHFDNSKNMITLDAEGDHLKFEVKDGMLIKRDKFGDPEQGAEEARYYLHPIK